MGKSTTTLFLFALGLLIVAVLSNENGSEGQLPCSDIHDELDCYDQFEKMDKSSYSAVPGHPPQTVQLKRNAHSKHQKRNVKVYLSVNMLRKLVEPRGFAEISSRRIKQSFPCQAFARFPAKWGTFAQTVFIHAASR